MLVLVVTEICVKYARLDLQISGVELQQREREREREREGEGNDRVLQISGGDGVSSMGW